MSVAKTNEVSRQHV